MLAAELGGPCVEVVSSEQALSAVQRDRPLLVLIDLCSGEHGERWLRGLRDGSDRSFRALGPLLQDVPLLAFIPTPDPEQTRRVYLEGVSDVLCQALGREVLGGKVRAWLRLAERAQRLLSLRDFAHEARHPITAIGAAAHMLISDGVLTRSDEDERRRLSQTILSESERIGRMVEHYLDADPTLRIGDAPLTEQPLDLIRDLLSVNLNSDQRRRVTMRAAGEIPELAVEPDHLRQMLLNLLENALTATAQQGEVCVEVFVDASGAAFAVRDTGVGIRPDDLYRIFEDGFTTASEAQHAQGGGRSGSSPNLGISRRRGLGLGITQRLCLSAGGKLSVSSQVGSGSVFVVWLPRPLR
jgi:signal transduction histidine kinase